MNRVSLIGMFAACLAAMLCTREISFGQRDLTSSNPPKAVQVAVQPFDLADVRLLDSPFLAAMNRNAEYLLQLEPDRFLHYFRTEAGLVPKAEAYRGWESASEGAGRCLGHYLSALSLQYRASGDQRFKDRIQYIASELAACQAANGNGMLSAEAGSKRFWGELASGNSDALKKHRVPWYIQHKMFAGLRDAYQLAGVTPAREVLLRLSDWAIDVTHALSDAQFQSMLEQEHGGMCEALADVYAITGNVKYLKLAERFEHRKVIDPLARGEDQLAGLHANTQIPKLIGVARLYELTGDASDRKTAEFFWHRVVESHSYANGGNSDDERFDAPNALAAHLRVRTSETCNTYNMLKLTRHLFQWEPKAEYADYYERALYNHILASVGPGPGNYTYYMAMKPGHFPVYSSPIDSFWCCVGTGMENHAKYGDSIYFHHDDQLYVNLFIPSELTWAERGMKLRLETRYPNDGQVRLTISCDKPALATIHVRYPKWAPAGMSVSVNGAAMTVDAQPSSYFTIDRTWKSGDVLEWTLPLTLRTEALPDDRNTVAIFYGPLLLAGKLAPLTAEHQLLHDSPASGGADPTVPELSVGAKPVDQWIVPIPGQAVTFQTRDAGMNSELTLVPFNQISHDRYTVYWHLVDSKRGQ